MILHHKFKCNSFGDLYKGTPPYEREKKEKKSGNQTNDPPVIRLAGRCSYHCATIAEYHF